MNIIKNKTISIVKIFEILLLCGIITTSISMTVPHDNERINPQTAGVDIDYGEYTYTSLLASGCDELDWSFTGVNPIISLNAMILDSENFAEFELGNDYDYYEVSYGIYPSDFGTFTVPYSEEWYFLVANIDDDQEKTDVELTYSLTENHFDGFLFNFGDYANPEPFAASGGDEINWECDSSNWEIGITVRIMDSINFAEYELGNDFKFYEVSNETTLADSGSFTIPYSGDWTIVFLNDDLDGQSTDMTLYFDIIENYIGGSNLGYNFYRYNTVPFSAAGGDDLVWNFESTNWQVGITVRVMDSVNLAHYQAGEAYHFYEVSDGGLTSDSGSFTIPYSEDWTIIFLNDDPDQLTTDLVCSRYVVENYLGGSNLGYSIYRYNAIPFSAAGGDDLVWDFESSNWQVGITVRVMDSVNLAHYQAGEAYHFYEVSDGSLTSDSGSFTIPYSEDWTIIFLNDDPDELTTDLAFSRYLLENNLGGSNLEYGVYRYNLVPFSAAGGDDLVWDFESSNWQVGIIVRVMDSVNLAHYQAGEAYHYYEVSDGSLTSDSGSFTIPYSEDWTIIFLNDDPDELTTDLACSRYLLENNLGGSNLEFGVYSYNSVPFSAAGGDDLVWNFESTNWQVGITVRVMDSVNLAQYQAGEAYHYYEVSDGSLTSDSGSFTIPYSEDWTIIFLNDDSDKLTTDLACSRYLLENNLGGSYLGYEDYIYNSVSFSAIGGDDVDWEFESSNWQVGITVFIMDAWNFVLFESDFSFESYVVSDGSNTDDFGTFKIPYSEDWRIVFLNDDPDELTTDLFFNWDLVENDMEGDPVDYGSYLYNSEEISAKGGDQIVWEFMSSNLEVGITVRIMDATNFAIYQASGIYTYYELSDGNYSTDFGTFTIPYSDDWIILFLNNDADQQLTEVDAEWTYVDNELNGILVEYNHYIHNSIPIVAQIGDTLDWEFSSTNSEVGLAFYIVDSGNFSLFLAGGSYSYYELSDGSYSTDFGTFSFPYSANWTYLIMNIDPSEFSTDCIYELEFDLADDDTADDDTTDDDTTDDDATDDDATDDDTTDDDATDDDTTDDDTTDDDATDDDTNPVASIPGFIPSITFITSILSIFSIVYSKRK